MSGRHHKLKSSKPCQMSNLGIGLLILCSPIILVGWIGCSIFGDEAFFPSILAGIALLDIILELKGD